MKLKKILNRIEQLDQLVRMKATGNSKALAEKLNISQSMLYYFMEMLKTDLEFPIQYCNKRKTYFYEESGRFICKFEKEEITDSLGKVKGGRKNVNAFKWSINSNKIGMLKGRFEEINV